MLIGRVAHLNELLGVSVKRPGRGTRDRPDKVARNYAVILLQPGPGPTHPLTF
jgi:hypothetical protein